MSNEYLYGAFGKIGDDIIQNVQQASTAAVYIGTAPVNLVSGYSAQDVINMPMRINNLKDAQRKVGDSTNWNKYTLCEAIDAHFRNPQGNMGPIYFINVLDPSKHTSTQPSSVVLSFANRRAAIKSDTIILDTLALDDLARGIDYTVEYDYTATSVIITDIGETPLESVDASYNEVDPTAVKKADIIGGVNDNGVATGIGALKFLYQKYNAIPDLLLAPKWSEDPEVYAAMVSAVQRVNGHWWGFVLADLSLDAQTRAEATQQKITDAHTSGFSKVFWPQVRNGNKIYHLSTLAAVETMRVNETHDGVPMGTPANKAIPITGLWLGENITTYGFDQPEANELCKNGITTAIFWESQWRIWGDHTAAYVEGGNYKPREYFDTYIRTLEYIANSFQRDWGDIIDDSMSLSLSETIRVREQEKLDILASKGAIIGFPEIVFTEENNPINAIANGNFQWDIIGTPTPLLKGATAVISYTDAGLSTYFGGDE